MVKFIFLGRGSEWEKKRRRIILGTMSYLRASCSHPGRQSWGDEKERYFPEKKSNTELAGLGG